MAISTTVKLRIDNTVWKKMERRLAKSESKSVKVGWWNTRHPSGVSTAQIAAWNEEGHINGGMFAGTYTRPRPFIRVGWTPLAKKTLTRHSKMFDAILQGKMTWNFVYNSLQKELKEDMQKTILDWNKPPNRPSTISLKGHGDVLIETGNMYDNVKSVLIKFSKGG